MAEINLTQAEADALIAMEKHRVSDRRVDFPMDGQSVVLPLNRPIAENSSCWTSVGDASTCSR